MKRCNWLTVGVMSLVTITGIGFTQAQAQTLLGQATTQTTKPQVPKTSQGFIPATLKQSTFPFEGGRNVFGKDDRIPMNSSKYPWSAIGRIEVSLDEKTLKICTGTLIGRSLVITNAHCVLDKETKQITTQKVRFRPNLIDGKSPTEAYATKIVPGTNNPQRDRGNDWAFLVLDQPLGETYGWMQFVIGDFADLESVKEQMTLVGYSHDFPKEKPAQTAGVHDGCSIRGFGPGLSTIAHDCDMMAGASGGPIFMMVQNGKKLSAIIVALNAAERISAAGKNPSKFSKETANIGVYAATWASKAEELLKAQR